MVRARFILLALLASFFPALVPSPASPADPWEAARERMVSRQIEARGVKDASVLAAMRRVPRHLFVPAEYRDQAYNDHPLPIGFGQTISQPYIVALMTELLKIRPGSRVLEVGTGSGYQAAVLAEITENVFTVEIIPELAERAERTLRETGYGKVRVASRDGYFGWEEQALFDAVIVTAAAEFVPPPLIAQLAVGGVMCIPVGPPFAVQDLYLVRKMSATGIVTEVVTQVRFVPLTGGKSR